MRQGSTASAFPIPRLFPCPNSCAIRAPTRRGTISSGIACSRRSRRVASRTWGARSRSICRSRRRAPRRAACSTRRARRPSSSPPREPLPVVELARRLGGDRPRRRLRRARAARRSASSARRSARRASLRRFLSVASLAGRRRSSTRARPIPRSTTLADELAQAFDADGTLSDRASPRLKELRSEYQTARTRMLSRLDDLMSKYEGILQDRYVTEREGRYVVPVRSDAHERFPGHRPLDERERRDALRRAARGHSDGQSPEGPRGRGPARRDCNLHASLGAHRRMAAERDRRDRRARARGRPRGDGAARAGSAPRVPRSSPTTRASTSVGARHPLLLLDMLALDGDASVVPERSRRSRRAARSW